LSFFESLEHITFLEEHVATLKQQYIQGVPLAIEPGISLIILTPMKILQRNLNRSTFVFGLVEEAGNQGDFIGRAYRRSWLNY
jgi:hypothetical protein